MTTTTPTTPRERELTGHDSPDTAYLVPDYPYGFRLRTEIRYWVETKKGHGQRTMSQTRNPKRAGAPWNAAKGSTYSPIRVLVLNLDSGHVEHHGLTGYADEAEIAAFVARFPLTCATERNAKTIEYMTARQRAHARIEWTITSGSDGPHQTREEQAAIVNKLTAIEIHKMRQEGGE